MGNKSQTSDREKFVEMLNKGEIEDIYIKVTVCGFVSAGLRRGSFFFRVSRLFCRLTTRETVNRYVSASRGAVNRYVSASRGNSQQF